MTVFALAALGHASTAVVLPPVGEAPDPDKLHSALQKNLARTDLALADASGLPDPEALRDTLLAHPTECGPWLPEEQLADLFALGRDIDELYVVLPTSRKPKTAVAWRFDAEASELFRVFSRKSALPDWQPPNPHVLALDLHGAAPDLPQALSKGTLVPSPETLDGASLVDQVMEHPSECTPPLDANSLEALDELGRSVDGELYLVVRSPLKREFAWRWDPDARRLNRLHLD